MLFRENRKEVHEVENPNDTPSDFLRIELKTEPVNDKSLRGKFHRCAPTRLNQHG